MAMFMPEPLVVEKAARPFQHAEAKLWWGGCAPQRRFSVGVYRNNKTIFLM
jgi:hypothetical protein